MGDFDLVRPWRNTARVRQLLPHKESLKVDVGGIKEASDLLFMHFQLPLRSGGGESSVWLACIIVTALRTDIVV